MAFISNKVASFRQETFMDATNQPFRSVLYIPASNERALEKARDLACEDRKSVV